MSNLRKTVPITSAVIRQVVSLELEINGKKEHGDFVLESEWNGLMRLECKSPSMHVIIRRPDSRKGNIYDKVHPLFGGNLSAWEKEPMALDIEIVSHSVDPGGVLYEASGPTKKP